MRHYGRLEGVCEMIGLNPVYHDNRGRFSEIYPIKDRPEIFPNGIRQVSHSISYTNVIRGIHWQVGMAKGFMVLDGLVDLFTVDLRRNSPTFGQWAVEDKGYRDNILYIPSGIGIGFRTLTKVHVQYLHSTQFDPALSFTLAWDDPTVDIDWSLVGSTPIMSDKDANEGISLTQWSNTFESTLPDAQLTDRPLVV
jgi:dTDP-4-dehydrorhamnose 3,5-epimerase